MLLSLADSHIVTMKKVKALASADLAEETRKMEAQLARMQMEKEKLKSMVPK